MSVPVQPAGPARRAYVWVCSTYFAEGFPYTIVNNLAELFVKALGGTVQAIGLTSLLHVPWNLKFVWGPLVDRYETKRAWILACEVALVAISVALVLAYRVGAPLSAMLALFAAMAVVSTVHDVAIDGFYLEVLDRSAQSRFVGLRAAFYRAASITVRGGLIVVVGVAGWFQSFTLAAIIMGMLLAVHVVVLPRSEVRRETWWAMGSALLRPWVARLAAVLAAIVIVEWWLAPLRSLRAAIARVPWLGSLTIEAWIGVALLTALLVMLAMLPRLRRRIEGSDSAYGRAFVAFVAQDRIGRALAFVILFRTGESFLEKMKMPFLLLETGMSEELFGTANGTVGLVASFTATILGGLLIARHGLRRWLWPFVLAQNVLNLLYAAVAAMPDPSQLGTFGLTAVITVEHFGAGLGTAVLLVYLMRLCRPGHRAAHMAILTALMSLGFTVAGVASGFLVSAMGYAAYFVFTFIATIPSMVLVFFVPALEEPPPESGRDVRPDGQAGTEPEAPA